MAMAELELAPRRAGGVRGAKSEGRALAGVCAEAVDIPAPCLAGLEVVRTWTWWKRICGNRGRRARRDVAMLLAGCWHVGGVLHILHKCIPLGLE
ncbi:hypothetical protein CFAM422_001203 [Trichoderma lentiforme]|uniref:Uncharacterized protein n=1 Tax=Trichoderma lentiforme TaxID=1567552 RepID=A0A9P4XP14_9HYPO|nr:hypothetical protein CFAM422_001203 [Trichoderma lentiforme]